MYVLGDESSYVFGRWCCRDEVVPRDQIQYLYYLVGNPSQARKMSVVP
jgi:hypothetical protein